MVILNKSLTDGIQAIDLKPNKVKIGTIINHK
jgi:hypothetical protein